MADKPLFTLDAKGHWRLAYDSNQWVLQRARKRKAPRRQKPPPEQFEATPGSILDWRGVSYVGGKKATLRRLFREKGVVLTAEAQARFDALPESFLDFVATPELFVTQWPEAEAA